MKTLSTEAFRAMEAARPASGFRPETEVEWTKLQSAQVELAYAMYRDLGESAESARAIANLIHGGAAGRMLLEMAFPEKRHD
jgi:hypothetical protein